MTNQPKNRNVSITDRTRDQLYDIGNGNRSLGIRTAAEFHARLVEQLTLAVNGEMNELEARLLLREVEVVK
jgi:hypothetical protein